ncbi:MAG: peptide ABC transporter substrate-binding protein [Arthrospira sp. PLM2.Bin9]|nr:ABC transporter substrate-binding protein [Arthrospira sp. PLM2.Bin9]TVU54282.1 MAG: peptide ABC transporter substrate-binding protein [Arthrospira sp. PLM2.Bin9]
MHTKYQMLLSNLVRGSRRRFRVLWQFLGLFGLVSFLIISCAQPNNQTTTTPGSSNGDERIIIGTTQTLRTIDPADAYEVISGNLLYNLGDRLYAYEVGTTQLKPQLATDFPTISDDRLTYTIPLRQGVLFHDDTPFNAEAMAFSLRRFIENGGPPSSLLSDIVEEITTTGEYELTIKLKRPFAAFPSLLAFSGACAVSPSAYEIGAGKFKPNSFVGTGPYVLTEYAVDLIRLHPFDQYWGDKPANQGVDLQRFSSPANLFNAFRTNAVDVAYISLEPDQIANLLEGAEQGRWQAISADGNTINYIVLNVNSEPLDRVEVRQAIASLVDRNLINERVLRGQAEPLYSLIPTTFESHLPVFKEAYGDANFEKAKQLLIEAGFTPENPAVVELWYGANSQKRQELAATLKALSDNNLGGILQLQPQSVDTTTAFQNLEKGIYPTFILDWYADFLDADNYIHPFLDCANGSPETGCVEGASQYHGSFYYSDRMNQLIRQQRTEANPETRQAIFQEIQQILAEDVPFIPLWQDKIHVFAQNNIQGVNLQANQQFPFWPLAKFTPQ